MTGSSNLILDSGKLLIAQALAKGIQFQVGQARIGSAVGFTPSSNSTSPTPATVYTVGAENISNQIVNGNEVQFNVTLTEIMGDFDVGNVMLDLLVGTTFTPFAWWVSDVAISKTAQSSNEVGNRFIISFTIEFQNIAEAISIVVTTPQYASLPSYSTELALPAPQQALYQQFSLQQYTRTRTPTIGMRRSADNRFFGIPVLQRLDHPYFGALLGGYAGDGYLPYTGNIYWGGYFISSPSEFTEIHNGGSFSDTVFTETIIADKFTYVQT